jgi:hypothetical protein
MGFALTRTMRSRSRSTVLALALLGAVACSGSSDSPTPNDDGGGGSSGSGTGGSGAISGAGGSGAISGTSGTSGTSPDDGNYSCPEPPYPTPPVATVQGAVPGLAFSVPLGGESSDILESVVALPDGGAFVVVAAGPRETATPELWRVGADGVVAKILAWSDHSEGTAVVGTDDAGNAVIASTATLPFEIDGESIGSTVDASTGFVYVLVVDAEGSLVSQHTFPYVGAVRLNALSLNAEGDLVLAGSLTQSLSFGNDVVSAPEFAEVAEPLRASFVVRLNPDFELTWQRVFHATGMHNEPPALDGTGGTDGFGQSSMTDVAWGPDDSVVVTSLFQGGIDLDDERFPNDGVSDGLVVKLDARGRTAWSHHVYGLIGENLPNPDGSGGSGGFVPQGVVHELSVDVAEDGRVAVTGRLDSRAKIGPLLLDAGASGAVTAFFDIDGAMTNAVPDGGTELALDASGALTVWDGASLFALDQEGESAWTLGPGGTLAVVPVRVARTPTGLLVAGSFLGRLDLGPEPIESAGCADVFIARFEP